MLLLGSWIVFLHNDIDFCASELWASLGIGENKKGFLRWVLARVVNEYVAIQSNRTEYTSGEYSKETDTFFLTFGYDEYYLQNKLFPENAVNSKIWKWCTLRCLVRSMPHSKFRLSKFERLLWRILFEYWYVSGYFFGIFVFTLKQRK